MSTHQELTATEREALKRHFPHRFVPPKIHPSVFQAPGSRIHGDVEIGKESSVWFNAVMRGDVNYIRIGEKTNIQDLSLIHVSFEGNPAIIGNAVTVGHSVVLHACSVRDYSLIGMGSCILDGAEIGEYVMLGAGSLVTQNTKIPSGSKAFGRPAKVVATLTEEEREHLRWSAEHYVRLAKTYF